MRLQPSSSRGSSFARSSRSAIALVICRRATARKGQPQPASVRQRRRTEIKEGEHRRPVEPLQQPEPLEQTLRPRSVGEVHTRKRPAGRALVDVDLLRDWLDRRHNLDRAAPGPDHRDALSRDIDIVTPARRMKSGASKAREPRDRRHARDRKLPTSTDRDVDDVRARACLQRPSGALIVPAGAGDLRAGADPPQHPVPPCDLLDVSLDLGLGRVAARPARIWRERELVQVRRDVAGRTRICVLVPDAAEPRLPLEHRDVAVARPLQHDRCADTPESCAHDGDRGVAGRAGAPATASARTHRGHYLQQQRRVATMALAHCGLTKPRSAMGTAPFAVRNVPAPALGLRLQTLWGCRPGAAGG
jgi:hypothetical protein